MITIWHGMTIQGLYCYLDMGNNTVMYHKCSHVPNLMICLFSLHNLELTKCSDIYWEGLVNDSICYCVLDGIWKLP